MTEMLLQFNCLGRGVVVVAATNRMQDIDPALLRRFERKYILSIYIVYWNA
jgi:SpoVK/Ycf46/Vps4 family AAA+-type ATPase